MAKKDPKSSSAEAQIKLRKFLSRRHPEYEESISHWQFLEDCYEGGREWFKSNIFRYIKEGDTEYRDRVARAYRFNHTREVVDLVDKYLFKMQVARNKEDAPDYLKKFWTNATLNKVSIENYMKQVSKMTSVYGRIWIVVDTNLNEPAISKAEEKKKDSRAYTYFVTPEHAVDMSWDDYGNLNWILLHEEVRDDENPLESSGEEEHRFRLWERDQYTVFKLTPNGKEEVKLNSAQLAQALADLSVGKSVSVDKYTREKSIEGYDITVEGPYPHSFGEVPVFHADNVINDEPYKSPSMIDDVAYLDRAVANYLSNLDAIIQDQTFSQLIMPAQGLLPGDEGYKKIIEMGTNRIFTYDGESGNKPEYISPDVRQAEIILKVINKIINEIYHTVGLAGERTKEDNALGIDNSSGVAKAYDFERVNSLLASKADSLELIENKLVNFVRRWNGDMAEVEDFVLYPENFDVRGLYDEFEIATTLGSIGAPEGVRRLQMDAVIEKLFPRLGKDLKEAIKNELKSWPPKLEVKAPGDTKEPVAGASGASDASTAEQDSAK